MKTMTMLVLLAGLAVQGMDAQQATAMPKPAPTPGIIAAHPDWPKANPDDVKSPEAIIQALSETISGESGKSRDWNRFNSLFAPGVGRMMIVRHSKTGPADLTALSTATTRAAPSTRPSTRSPSLMKSKASAT